MAKHAKKQKPPTPPPLQTMTKSAKKRKRKARCRDLLAKVEKCNPEFTRSRPHIPELKEEVERLKAKGLLDNEEDAKNQDLEDRLCGPMEEGAKNQGLEEEQRGFKEEGVKDQGLEEKPCGPEEEYAIGLAVRINL